MKKTFDAVAFQRKRRKELSEEYLKDPKAYMKKLRDKYGNQEHKSLIKKSA